MSQSTNTTCPHACLYSGSCDKGGRCTCHPQTDSGAWRGKGAGFVTQPGAPLPRPSSSPDPLLVEKGWHNPDLAT